MRLTITLAAMLAAANAWAAATQSFYQVVSFPSNPAYFGSNVYLHDSPTALHIRLGEMAVTNRIVTASGITYTITNDPAAANDILVFSPASSTACFAAQSAAGEPTNQVVDVLGIKYTITNQPANAADILYFVPANTTAYFGVLSDTNTTRDHAALTNANGAADVQHLTAGEKAVATNPVVVNGTGGLTVITNAPGNFTINGSSAYQPYSAEIASGAGDTATISLAHGNLVRIICTNAPTTLTFDTASYATAGVSRVALVLWAGTNSVAFDSATITNATAPIISATEWNSLLFRRVEGDAKWKGRQ